MTATKILRTQTDVVTAFGGPAEFAKRFGTARTAPYNYRRGVPMPPRLLYAVIAACGRDGFRLGAEIMSRAGSDVVAGIAEYHTREA